MKYINKPFLNATYKLMEDNKLTPYFSPKKLKIKDVTPMHLNQYVLHRLNEVSPNTVRKHLYVLSRCFESAVKQNTIMFNPVRRIEMPKKVKYTGAQYLDEDQIVKLLMVCKGDPIMEPIINIALFFGLRKSELLGLKWDAVDLKNRKITIQHTVVGFGKHLHKMDSTKNKSSYQTIPMAEYIRDYFIAIKKRQNENRLLQPNDYIDEGYVFTLDDGRLIHYNYVSILLHRLMKKADLPSIRFHDLRHSTASYMKHLGFDMKDIQEWLRHGDIGTTMNIYTHFDQESLRNISDKLEEKL